jgi:predicted nucleic acid-binding Zn ribbon protein
VVKLYQLPSDEEVMRLPTSHMRYGGGHTLVCDVCGRAFRARHPRALYCSARCSNDAYIERRRERRVMARTKSCVVCGETFTATRRDAKTCSPACRQKSYRQRARKEA